MGGNDHCAVFGCKNSRNKPEKLVKKDHIGILRWHCPKNVKDMKVWEKMLNRGGSFKMSMSTKVCSNHFAAGYCSDVCPIPTLFLKGYDVVEEPLKRKTPVDRTDVILPPKKTRQLHRDGYKEILSDEDHIFTPYVNEHNYNKTLPITPYVNEHNYDKTLPITPYVNEHNYDETLPTSDCARSVLFTKCNGCCSKEEKIKQLLDVIATQKKRIAELQDCVVKAGKKKCFNISDINQNDKYVSIYTGLQNAKVFEWLHYRIEYEAKHLQYYKQKSNQKQKANRKLDTRTSLFLVLVKLRLGLTDNDLAFRFQISQSTVTTILNSWLPFLSEELKHFIYWPTKEENANTYPKCFKKFPNTIGIIDCTEGAIEKPSLAKAQAQTYSTYKSRNTWKVLICVTPSGTVSYISKTYGGCASDRYITETCGILDKVQPGDSLMADKGFNISDLLVGKGSKLVIPQFLNDKGKFSNRNATKTVAKARIHVERAISRIKDYRILQGAIPLTRKDKLNDILTICAALTNLAPPLVPL